jgi:teichuronic acid biosynthesis protein TuaE
VSAHTPPLPLTKGPLIAVALGAVPAAIAAAYQPLAGLALGVMALALALVRDTSLRRIGVILVFATALAGIAGPNLAPPGAGWLFAFRVLIVALALGAIGYVLLGGRISIPRGLERPFALLGLWVLWSAVSIGWAEDEIAALRWTAFLAMMSGLVIALALVCRTTHRVKILLALLLGAFAVALLVAAAELLAGVRLPTSRPGRDASAIFGATSLFGNQNNFATFLTLSLPYFAVLPVVYRDVRLRALGLIGMGAALLGLVYTGSKANVVAAGLVFLALFVVLGLDQRMRGRIVGAAVIGGLAALLVIPTIQGSGVVKLPEQGVTKFDFSLLSEQLESGTGSGALRSSLARDALALIEETRGLGVGAGNAETQVKALDAFARVANLHNWWLEVAVNGGLVALLLFGGFYFRLLVGQLRITRRTDDRFVRYLSLAGGLSLIGFFAGSFGPSTAIHFVPMWIVFALGVIAVNLGSRRPS